MVAQRIAVIDAAVAAGVERSVKVSVLGARPGGKLAEGAHWQIELHLRAAPVEWSLVRPSGFMQTFVTGYPPGEDLAGDWRVAYIDAFDIAACAAVLLTGEARPGATFDLTGPEALTQAEIASKLSVGSLELTADEMRARLIARGLPPSFAADVVELWGDVAATGSLATVTPAVRDLTGRDPRTFDDFLAAHRAHR